MLYKDTKGRFYTEDQIDDLFAWEIEEMGIERIRGET